MPNLQEKINNFNDTYGTLLDERFDTTIKKMQYLDMYMLGNGTKNLELATYARGLNSILKNYVESKTTMGPGFVYDMSGLKIADLVRDYEEIVAMKNAALETPRARAPYEGATMEKVVNHVLNESKKYDRTIGTMWADRVMSGKLTMEAMREMTENAYSNLSYARVDKVDSIDKKNIKDILMAKEAMEQVRERRGFFWKIMPWNWSKNSQEKAYLARLSMFEDSLMERGLPVNEMQEEISKTVMTSVYENAESVEADVKNVNNEMQNERQSIQVNEVNVNVQEKAVAPVEEAPVINAPTINKN